MLNLLQLTLLLMFQTTASPTPYCQSFIDRKLIEHKCAEEFKNPSAATQKRPFVARQNRPFSPVKTNR